MEEQKKKEVAQEPLTEVDKEKKRDLVNLLVEFLARKFKCRVEPDHEELSEDGYPDSVVLYFSDMESGIPIDADKILPQLPDGIRQFSIVKRFTSANSILCWWTGRSPSGAKDDKSDKVYRAVIKGLAETPAFDAEIPVEKEDDE